MSLLAPSPAAPIDYSDERTVRLLLSRLIEPEDHLFAELREAAAPAPALASGPAPGPAPAPAEPAELLRAIIGDRASPTPPWPARLAERLESRRAGIRLKLACADPVADFEAGAAAEARFLIPGDADWPSRLDDLGGRAPFGIWIIGRFEPRAPAVAMVGARACTGYGSQAAGQLAADLARAGTTVVSGAALGVDGAAHRGALAVGGTTVAVLACGIDRAYPASHRTLIEAIGERGAVLAELPPGTSPTRFRFLARNRLIAALGLGTIVVEAAGRSGSLVTARLAAELGRAVFAVPGPVTSRQSVGTNQLLCDGAIPAVDGPRILAELGVESARGEPAPRRADTPPASGPAPDTAPLEPRAVLVREALPTARSGRAAGVLSLATATGLAPPQVLALLGQLAACGQVVKTGSGWALR
jgi:DNA processing protein